MNGFQAHRWIGRWMISPLARGPEEAGTRNADIVTNTLTIATKPGRISKGWKGGMRSADVPLAAAAPRTITWVSQLTAGAVMMLTSCQETGGGACGCARVGKTRRPREQVQARWEDAPGDIRRCVPPLPRPRLWRRKQVSQIGCSWERIQWACDGPSVWTGPTSKTVSAPQNIMTIIYPHEGGATRLEISPSYSMISVASWWVVSENFQASTVLGQKLDPPSFQVPRLRSGRCESCK